MKFLRRIFGAAASPAKRTDYLKYAVGEIVLVVVGILIAVSINNWNEDRRRQAELQEIFLTVKEDLENDLAEIAEVFALYERLAPRYEQVLSGAMTREAYEATPAIAFLIVGFPEISFDQRGLHLLQDFTSGLASQPNELLSQIIEFYSERMLEIEVDDKLRADDFVANFNHWKETQDWWAAYIHEKKIDGFINYALHDPDYRNRVATSHFLTYEVYLPELRLFDERARTIIAEIERLANR